VFAHYCLVESLLHLCVCACACHCREGADAVDVCSCLCAAAHRYIRLFRCAPATAEKELMLRMAELCKQHPNRHRKPGQKADAGAGSSSSAAAAGSSKGAAKKSGKKKK
jgi:hypothetical protein